MAELSKEQEVRIRNITKFYYSNPKVIEALLKFAQNRETVPRYFEGFGKRPDAIQYPSDIMGLVNKGATSLHCSEELWNDPLAINSDMSQDQFNNLRKSWDLLIDIDSPYLDLSKIAAVLVVKALEFHGIYNYGIKFSGSKGFHVIVSGNAFPEEYQGKKTKDMFPEWPRAITEYLFNWINPAFRKEAGRIMTLTNKDEGKIEMHCLNCERPALQGFITKFRCSVCEMGAERKDTKLTKRKLRCLNSDCAGFLEVVEEKPYFYCELCKSPDNEKIPLSSDKYPESFREQRGEQVSEHAKFDLVLVAPRHLFRMPYSLHEKTALASIVLTKDKIESFNPRDANPMTVKVTDFFPNNFEGEGTKLLKEALDWKSKQVQQQEQIDKKYYSNYKSTGTEKTEFEEINSKDVKDEMFPAPIKKLLKGLGDGRKRGLFILITFFRSLNYSPEEINNRIREWNQKNQIQLKEGYVKSQINWHLKQRKKILPPNYDNDAFYKDLGLLDKKPEVKNPLVELKRNMWKSN